MSEDETDREDEAPPDDHGEEPNDESEGEPREEPAGEPREEPHGESEGEPREEPAEEPREEPRREERPPREEPPREEPPREEPPREEPPREERPPRDEPPREDRPPRQPRRTGPTITDRITAPAVMDQLKYVVGIHTIFGLGLGVMSLLTSSLLLSRGSSSIGFVGGLFGVGLLLSFVLTFQTEERMDDDVETRDLLLAVGIGNGAGFFVFGFISVLLAVMTIPGILGLIIGSLFLMLLVSAPIVGAVSAGFLYFRNWLDRPSRPPRQPAPRGEPTPREEPAPREEGYEDDRR